jgi:iron complex outermembrane receptor protein
LKAQTGWSAEDNKSTTEIELIIGKNFDDGLIATDSDYSPVHKSAVDTDGDSILDTSQYVDSSYILGGRIVRYEGDECAFVGASDGTDLRFF